jgi:hypothetical protein
VGAGSGFVVVAVLAYSANRRIPKKDIETCRPASRFVSVAPTG